VVVMVMVNAFLCAVVRKVLLQLLHHGDQVLLKTRLPYLLPEAEPKGGMSKAAGSCMLTHTHTHTEGSEGQALLDTPLVHLCARAFSAGAKQHVHMR